MPFANTSISDVMATTIQNRSGVLADNVSNNNALLRTLKKRGNVRTVSGGDYIMEEIMYDDSSTRTVDSYTGYDAINISPNSPISSAQYDFKQYAGSMSVSGLEMLRNAGKEQQIDLVAGRMQVLEAQLQNRIGSDIYLDGTGNGGKNITGLALAVPDAPTSGTYGGINRANWAFWQSKKFSGTVDGSGAVSAVNIQQYMTTLALRLVRGTNKADLIVADSNYFALYANSLQALQRFASEEEAAAGFAKLKFWGGGAAADVICDGGVGAAATANHMWFLNTSFIFWRPHAERNFVPIGGQRQAVNQDAIVKLVGFAGNLTSSGPQFCGVLIA